MSEAPNKLAQHFRHMADQIERNADQKFGGAYVILPPGDVEPISVLVLDAASDPAAFFNLLDWRVKNKLAEIDEQQRRAQGFGR